MATNESVRVGFVEALDQETKKVARAHEELFRDADRSPVPTLTAQSLRVRATPVRASAPAAASFPAKTTR